MSEIIAKSYRIAAIPIDSEKMLKREISINDYLENSYGSNDILDLVKMFFDENCNKEFLNRFTGEFAKEDNTFADDQKKELQVLAGIVLNKICESEDINDLFKIVIYIKSYIFIGDKPILDDICQKIQLIYEKKAAENRDDIVFEYESISQLSQNVSFSLIEESQIYEMDRNDINKLIFMVKKINELCRFINKNYRDLMNKNKILYENTELLWWLLAGYSNDEDKAYSELSDKQEALLVGKDLAEVVQCKPGPYLAKNLLYKMLSENKHNKYLFKEYIDVCKDSTIEKILSGKEDRLNTPILYALCKKMEVGEANWIKAFEKKFGYLKLEYSDIEIAYQMYLECLMLKW